MFLLEGILKSLYQRKKNNLIKKHLFIIEMYLKKISKIMDFDFEKIYKYIEKEEKNI
ncbi:hypothetical protein [Candidatus Phytoplasma fraxini]|uniref:hypothetical protein n=1 Tax=Ash yellows phytoplasma TaxID=35780 RepID=UPI0030FE3C4B